MENALLGSRALEAGIALAVVYIILSVAGSAFVEVLFQLFRVRARLLGNAITALLHEESSTNNHATKSKRHKLSLFGKSITLLLEDEKSTNNQAVKSTKEP